MGHARGRGRTELPEHVEELIIIELPYDPVYLGSDMTPVPGILPIIAGACCSTRYQEAQFSIVYSLVSMPVLFRN